MKFWTGLWLLAAAPLLLAAENMEVIGSRVNIRRDPSVKGQVIGSVKAGERVKVRQIKNGWAELEGRPGFVSATYLRKAAGGPPPGPGPKPAPHQPEKPGPKPAPHQPAKPVAQPKPGPAGQVFADLPVVPGSKRDVTIRGMLYPIPKKGHVRYVLLKAVGKKYVPQCYVYVPDRDAGKYKEFANAEVQLVGYWYKIPNWKMPVMQVRRLKGL